MLLFISPAKSLELEREYALRTHSIPEFQEQTAPIIKVLKKMKPSKIAKTFELSDKLAQLNYERYQTFGSNESIKSARPAIFTFDGEVYNGLDAFSLSDQDISFAQKHLRILSGLYGILKPLDLIEPYRLEMGSDIHWGKNKNLYDYWKAKITQNIKVECTNNSYKYIINLASQEYFKAINRKKIGVDIIDIDFLEIKGSKTQNISFFSKKARGLMSRYIIENELKTPEEIKTFSVANYQFSEILSSTNKFVFTREAKLS